MIYRTLLTVGVLAATVISTPAFGNGSPTFVDTCGVVSSYAGETMLVTADIDSASSGSCIFITHDDVTLDCQGYRLTYTGLQPPTRPNPKSRGVVVFEGSRVTVQNCELYDWTNGILYALTEGGVILHNKLVGNLWGIGVAFSGLAWVEGNKADATKNAGIQVFESSENVIYNNVSHGSGWAGILLNGFPEDGDGADNNYVVDNQVNLNGDNGILLELGSEANFIFNNTANRNDGNGIALLDSSEGNDVEKNVVNRNDIGILSEGSNNFDRNRCHKNFTADSVPGGLCK